MIKFAFLPYATSIDELHTIEVEDDKLSIDAQLVRGLLLPLSNVLRAHVRLQQRFAVLIHIEALRDYAAQHQGKFPKSLKEIKLPLPMDSVSGQAID